MLDSHKRKVGKAINNHNSSTHMLHTHDKFSDFVHENSGFMSGVCYDPSTSTHGNPFPSSHVDIHKSRMRSLRR
jgi:hypothetical protein